MITSPTDIPNCQLWLDASDLSTMYTEVTTSITDRINYLYPSEEYTSNYWTATVVTLSTLSEISPIGTSNATKVIDSNYSTTNSVNRYLYRTVFFPTSGVYTISTHLKKFGIASNYASFLIQSPVSNVLGTTTPGITIELNTGVVTPRNLESGSSFGSLLSANSWYRAYFSITIPQSTTNTPVYLSLIISSNSSSPGYTYGAGISCVGIWGSQIEKDTTVGAYISSSAAVYGVSGLSPMEILGKITPLKTSPTTPTKYVKYWANKSLSASVWGLSGVFNTDPNSSPTLQNWYGSLSSVYLNNSYLTGIPLIQSLSADEQTIFIATMQTASQTGRTPYIYSQADKIDTKKPDLVFNCGYDTTYVYSNVNYAVIYGYTTYVSNSAYSAVGSPVYFINWLTPDASSTNTLHILASQKQQNLVTNYFNGLPSPWATGRLWYSAIPLVNSYAPPLISSVDLFRIGQYISSDITSGTGGGQAMQTTKISEFLYYDRALTVDERNDVECYLVRKWSTPTYRRNIWVIDDTVEISDPTAFNTINEPAPWNAVLSSDIIYLNGKNMYLSTDLNYATNIITCAKSPQGNNGGNLALGNVTLSANIVGGTSVSSPLSQRACVTPDSGSVCTIVGNIYGGGFTETATSRYGVYLNTTSTLYLSGNVTGGNRANAHGVYLQGFSNQNLFIKPGSTISGGGKLAPSNGNYRMGNTGAYGIFASAHIFNLLSGCNINAGQNQSAGILAISNTVLSAVNCTFTSGSNRGFPRQFSTVPAGYPVVTNGFYPNDGTDEAYPTALTFTGTTFFTANSCTFSINTVFNAGSDKYTNTGGVYLGSDTTAVLTDCVVNIPAANSGYNFVGINNTAVLPGGSLTTYNLKVHNNDANRGTTTATDGVLSYIGSSYTCSLRNSGTAVLYNTLPDTSPYMGILMYNSGSLSAIGGSYIGSTTTNSPALYNDGNLYIQGATIKAGAANTCGAGLYNNSGSCILDGIKLYQGTFTKNNIVSRGGLTAIYVDPFLSSLRGYGPITAKKCVYVSLCANSLYTRYAGDGLETYVTYRDSAYTLDYPLSTDVLLGTVYTKTGSLTGTAIVPPASSVLIGARVGPYLGTVRPIAVDAFWNQPITTVVPAASTVYERLIQPKLVTNALSAIVNSMWNV